MKQKFKYNGVGVLRTAVLPFRGDLRPQELDLTETLTRLSSSNLNRILNKDRSKCTKEELSALNSFSERLKKSCTPQPGSYVSSRIVMDQMNTEFHRTDRLEAVFDLNASRKLLGNEIGSKKQDRLILRPGVIFNRYKLMCDYNLGSKRKIVSLGLTKRLYQFLKVSAWPMSKRDILKEFSLQLGSKQNAIGLLNHLLKSKILISYQPEEYARLVRLPLTDNLELKSKAESLHSAESSGEGEQSKTKSSRVHFEIVEPRSVSTIAKNDVDRIANALDILWDLVGPMPNSSSHEPARLWLAKTVEKYFSTVHKELSHVASLDYGVGKELLRSPWGMSMQAFIDPPIMSHLVSKYFSEFQKPDGRIVLSDEDLKVKAHSGLPAQAIRPESLSAKVTFFKDRDSGCLQPWLNYGLGPTSDRLLGRPSVLLGLARLKEDSGAMDVYIRGGKSVGSELFAWNHSPDNTILVSDKSILYGLENTKLIYPHDVLVRADGVNIEFVHKRSGRLINFIYDSALALLSLGNPLELFLVIASAPKQTRFLFWHWYSLNKLPYLPEVCTQRGVILSPPSVSPLVASKNLGLWSDGDREYLAEKKEMQQRIEKRSHRRLTDKRFEQLLLAKDQENREYLCQTILGYKNIKQQFDNKNGLSKSFDSSSFDLSKVVNVYVWAPKAEHFDILGYLLKGLLGDSGQAPAWYFISYLDTQNGHSLRFRLMNSSKKQLQKLLMNIRSIQKEFAASLSQIEVRSHVELDGLYLDAKRRKLYEKWSCIESKQIYKLLRKYHGSELDTFAIHQAAYLIGLTRAILMIFGLVDDDIKALLRSISGDRKRRGQVPEWLKHAVQSALRNDGLDVDPYLHSSLSSGSLILKKISKACLNRDEKIYLVLRLIHMSKTRLAPDWEHEDERYLIHRALTYLLSKRL